jgi:hypothetical protein
MNIVFTRIGDYHFHTHEKLDEELGLTTVREYKTSPTYFIVNDKQKFFLAIIKYGIEFKELSDEDIERRMREYLQEFGMRNRMLRGFSKKIINSGLDIMKMIKNSKQYDVDE